MSDHEESRPGHILAWALTATLLTVGASIMLSAIFFLPRSAAFYPFFGFGWLFTLFWIFIIYFAISWLFWPSPSLYQQYGDNVYHILRASHAKGEITKEQFDQMMRDLQQHG